MEPKKWVRLISNGNVYEYDEGLLATGRYEVYWEPPLPKAEEIKPQPVAADSDRMKAIREAIAQIDKKNWSKAVGNRPAMPKVAAVSFLAGFPVSANEIVLALQENER